MVEERSYAGSTADGTMRVQNATAKWNVNEWAAGVLGVITTLWCTCERHSLHVLTNPSVVFPRLDRYLAVPH